MPTLRALTRPCPLRRIKWLIHKFILHFFPQQILGRTVNFYLPKTHRRHHAGLHYKWVHYLTHITWCPLLVYHERCVLEHRRHHSRNENYWRGVSFDRDLGIYQPKVGQ